MVDVHAALADVFREESGRLTAALVHILGDFAVAEEIVQDALLVALERWPSDGIPERPGAWLLTVARRRALNHLSRDARYHAKLAQLEQPVPREEDDRVRLMFTCCHPALSREAQIALTLRAVCGFTTAEIAHAFLASEAAVAQRIVRARRKIVAAHIPYRMPTEEDMGERLREVLAVLYLVFTEGYLASSGLTPTRRNLAEDAAWLTALIMHYLPGEPEPLGLFSLMQLHLARSKARFTSTGELILLQDQDRTLWDQSMIQKGIALIEQAAALGRLGPYQVEAAIVACHAEAVSWVATDWRQIVLLYDLLYQLKPTPVVRLNRAVALWQIMGPEAALAEVNALTRDLENYHLFHAIRGELLLDLSKKEQARASALRAMELTHNPAERCLLARRALEW
jgi:RNA polymerase sigma factor (sigma-70 family)